MTKRDKIGSKTIVYYMHVVMSKLKPSSIQQNKLESGFKKYVVNFALHMHA